VKRLADYYGVMFGVQPTIRLTIMISQPPLIIYIFQPMLVRPIGIKKTNTSLRIVSIC
jgi:hypothetical protein